MFPKATLGVMVLGLLAVGASPARAQWAVIDVSAVGQLVQEVEQLRQQVATAKSQLNQAQTEYSAITGNRGMQLLLSGTQRNYLPTDWTQIAQVMSGASGSFPALAGAVQALVQSNAVLTAGQVSVLSPAEQAQLTQARQVAALQQALARSALQNSSARFAQLQQLIQAIGSATDQKGVLDLNARIAAEAGMLQNESTKLQVLFQIAQSQEWTRAQRAREQVLADHGSLRLLPPMGL